jgi:hypothetical protein
MSETAAIVFIGVTVLILLLVTLTGIHFLGDVLGGEDHDDHEDHGKGGAAH